MSRGGAGSTVIRRKSVFDLRVSTFEGGQAVGDSDVGIVAELNRQFVNHSRSALICA